MPGPDRGSRADVVFGVFLLALAVLILAASDSANRIGAALVATVLGGLGIEAIVAARRGRRSLVSRIGPLP